MEQKTTPAASGDAVTETALKYMQDMPEKDSLPFEEGKRYTYSDYCTWEDFSDGKYRLDVYNSEDTVPVGVLEGCVIDLAEVFSQ